MTDVIQRDILWTLQRILAALQAIEKMLAAQAKEEREG